MTEKKEVIYDELFIRAMQNSRRYFNLKWSESSNVMSVSAWEACLKEHTITWDFMDRFFYEDEQYLGLFILKWS
jgi:hypothetical protein